MPFLSVIVPVFNKVNYIDSCIESILGQSFEDFELILVDDGSTDGSDLRCDQFKDLDPRIIVIHQENMGVSAARNSGIAISSGQYVGFIDSDDTIENDMYEILVKNVISSDSDISVCAISKKYKGRTLKLASENKVEILDRDKGLSYMLEGTFDLSVNNKIFRAGIARAIKFEGRFKEDFLYNIYAFTEAETSVFQNISKYNYILRENSVSIEKLNEKDMEGLSVDSMVLDLISARAGSHLEEAQINFFVQNISILNLVLLGSRAKYSKEYEIVTENLKKYSFLLRDSVLLRKKHRVAYYLFRASPLLYTLLLRFYILFIPSEAGTRDK